MSCGGAGAQELGPPYSVGLLKDPQEALESVEFPQDFQLESAAVGLGWSRMPILWRRQRHLDLCMANDSRNIVHQYLLKDLAESLAGSQ